MTRKEQIKKAAKEYLGIQYDELEREPYVFIAGAEWADANPENTIVIEKYDVPFIKNHIAALEARLAIAVEALEGIATHYIWDEVMYATGVDVREALEKIKGEK